MLTAVILGVIGLVIAGGSRQLFIFLRRRHPFPTGFTTFLEIGAPFIGLLFVLAALLALFREIPI